jgi:hypothetical protein
MNKRAEIRRLNDCFRKNPQLLGKIVMTRNVADMGPVFLVKCLYTLKVYDAFTKDNDPYGEHDMCTFEVDGQKVWFKIEYFNHDMTAGSEDPANPAVTVRLGTLLFPEDY